ncbi:hypothetical protein CY35_05G143300 [Sphagnum magellanicum]|nr:hypothetical protein CY35_05G143300 [Sphagnum magellanicum]
MQYFLHPQSAAAGGVLLPVARAQFPIRHLLRPVSNKFSQKSVAKVLAFGEADCVNRRVNFATTQFVTGENNLPLQLPAMGSLLEHNCTASNVVGSLRTSVAVVAAATKNSSRKANADCIDNSAQLLTEDMARGVSNGYGQTKLGRAKTGALEVGGFSIEGVSIGGQETCVMVPAYKVAFDSGRCPERIIHQDFLFITHPHMDHIDTVEKLFLIQRELDGSDLPVNLIGLDIGEEFDMGKNVVVKAFKTYHVVPSQGYILYSVKEKLKPEYMGLPGDKIKSLKASGIMITETIKVPEVAFTGDTTSNFITNKANQDALDAKLLIMESTFLDNYMSVEKAHEYGHTHFSEIVALGDHFKNKNIVLTHFSARYTQEDIFKALKDLPPILQGRVVALTEGF